MHRIYKYKYINIYTDLVIYSRDVFIVTHDSDDNNFLISNDLLQYLKVA